MEVRPLNDWCIVKYNKNQEKISRGGIVLAELDSEHKNKERLLCGIVVAVGPGKQIEGANGLYHKPMTRKAGEVVLYSKYAKGTIESTDDLAEYHNVKDGDIIAVIEK